MNSHTWPERSVIRPADLTDLLQKLANRRLGKYELVWRGVSDITWRLDPGAVRKLALELNTEPEEITEAQLSAADSKLLAEARQAGVDRDNVINERLTDDQLRARLQHQGAATRLLDVSTSAFTALWMAVNEGTDKGATGALFAIDMPVSEVEPASDVSKAIAADPDALYLWSVSSSVDARIQAQSGKFLVSAVPPKVEKRKLTSLALEFVDRDLHRLFSDTPGPGRYSASPTIIFALSPDLKSETQEFLRRIAGMTATDIYPDLAGFARSHSVNS